MDEHTFKRCDKSFKFGGDASGHSRWMVKLPVKISGHPGRIQACIIYGATPMLFGRPLLEALQAEINFGKSRMRLLHQEWQDISRGRQSAMLLRLAADVKHLCDFKELVFDFRCEDDHDSGTSLHEFLDDLNAHECYFEMTTEVKTCFSLHDHEEIFATVEEDDQQPLLPGEACKTIEQLQKTMSWIEAQLQETEKHVQQKILHARDSAAS